MQNRKSILIVNDEQDIIMIIKMALQRSGWAVKEFTDPILALEHFERHSKDYDAILSDISFAGTEVSAFPSSLHFVHKDIDT